MMLLPKEITMEILDYLDILSRIRYYSIMIPKNNNDINNDTMIPIHKIFDYYNEPYINQLSSGDVRLCKCLELWIQSLPPQDMISKCFLEIKQILTKSQRSIERHFTEIWTEYGAILELDNCWSTIINPPRAIWDNHFINEFLSEKIGRNEKLLNYGFGDMVR